MAVATLAGNERLAIFARFGVGYDNVDVLACTPAGVAAYDSPRNNRSIRLV